MFVIILTALLLLVSTSFQQGGNANSQTETSTSLGAHSITQELVPEACSSRPRTSFSHTKELLEAYHSSLSWTITFGISSTKSFIESNSEGRPGWVIFWTILITLPLILISLLIAILVVLAPLSFLGSPPMLKIFGNYRDEIFEDPDKANDIARKFDNKRKREAVEESLNTKQLKSAAVGVSLCCFGFALIVLFFWLYYAINSFTGTRRTECGLAYLNNDILSGFNSKTELLFGTQGSKLFYESMSSNTESLQKMFVAGMDDLINAKLDQKAENLISVINEFSGKFGAVSVSSCSGSPKYVRTDVARQLEPNITTGIGQEVYKYVFAAETLTKAAGLIKVLDSVKYAKYKASVEKMVENIAKIETEHKNSISTLTSKLTNHANLRAYLVFHIWFYVLMAIIGLTLFMVFIQLGDKIEGLKKTLLPCQTIILIVMGIIALCLNYSAIHTYYRAAFSKIFESFFRTVADFSLN